MADTSKVNLDDASRPMDVTVIDTAGAIESVTGVQPVFVWPPYPLKLTSRATTLAMSTVPLNSFVKGVFDPHGIGTVCRVTGVPETSWARKVRSQKYVYPDC
jgi:hypothetical protein